MTRRPVLPGASELFRRTDTKAEQAEVTELPSLSTTAASPALRGTTPARREETTVAGQPITTWAPTSSGASAYRDLAKEVLAL